MNKGDPEDLRRLAEDLTDTLQDHPDALDHNPDIASDLAKVRDKTRQRYEKVGEKRPNDSHD